MSLSSFYRCTKNGEHLVAVHVLLQFTWLIQKIYGGAAYWSMCKPCSTTSVIRQRVNIRCKSWSYSYSYTVDIIHPIGIRTSTGPASKDLTGRLGPQCGRSPSRRLSSVQTVSARGYGRSKEIRRKCQ